MNLNHINIGTWEHCVTVRPPIANPQNLENLEF